MLFVVKRAAAAYAQQWIECGILVATFGIDETKIFMTIVFDVKQFVVFDVFGIFGDVVQNLCFQQFAEQSERVVGTIFIFETQSSHILGDGNCFLDTIRVVETIWRLCLLLYNSITSASRVSFGSSSSV